MAKNDRFIPLPGREFVMGDDSGRSDERPAHAVTLSPFRVSIAPVTVAEYGRFLRETGNAAPRPFPELAECQGGGFPVVGISWFDAIAYCEWLCGVTGERFRLPTEAEREYAARGGRAGGDWPWGDIDPAERADLREIATGRGPHVPSDLCANGFGLLCMADNVHEWCSDWYDPSYYPRSPAEDPPGPESGRRRASRGGSWRHQVKFNRCAARSSLDPAFHYNDYGFRVYADS